MTVLGTNGCCTTPGLTTKTTLSDEPQRPSWATKTTFELNILLRNQTNAACRGRVYQEHVATASINVVILFELKVSAAIISITGLDLADLAD